MSWTRRIADHRRELIAQIREVTRLERELARVLDENTDLRRIIVGADQVTDVVRQVGGFSTELPNMPRPPRKIGAIVEEGDRLVIRTPDDDVLEGLVTILSGVVRDGRLVLDPGTQVRTGVDTLRADDSPRGELAACDGTTMCPSAMHIIACRSLGRR